MKENRLTSNCTRACSNCRSRKVRCNGVAPCANCMKHNQTCIYPMSQRGKRDKPRTGGPSLEDRLNRMEGFINEIRSGSSQPRLEAFETPTESNVLPPAASVKTSLTVHHQHDQILPHTSQHQQLYTPETTSHKSRLSYCHNQSRKTASPPPSAAAESSTTGLGLPWFDPVRTVVSPLYSVNDLATIKDLNTMGVSDSRMLEVFPLETQIWEHHGPGSWCSLCSEPGVRWVLEKTGEADFAKTAQKLACAWNRHRTFKGLSTPLGNPEPGEETAWRYTKAYFEECFESILGVVYRPEFETRLRLHFARGGPSTAEDASWFALRNTVYAAGCRQELLKNDLCSYAEAQTQAYRYFENALSVHVELMYGQTGLLAVRALAAMAFYAESAANEGFEFMIFANAVRLAQAKGLHRQPSKTVNIPEDEISHRGWLFWAIYCGEKHVAYRSGRPSATEEDNISCAIPGSAPSGSTIDVALFTHLIKLFQMVSKVSRRLGSVSAFRQSPSEFIKASNESFLELEAWRAGVEEFHTPGRPIKYDQLRPNVRPIHIAFLHYMYYAFIPPIYAVFGWPWISAILGLHNDQAFQKEAAEKAAISADAARNIILIAKSTELSAAVPQWASFYFPIAGLINLFIFVLNNPTLPSAPGDVALLDVSAGHFSHMEFLTGSDPEFPFTREVARLARATVEKANRKKSKQPNEFSPPAVYNTDNHHYGSDAATLLSQPDLFQADDFDMEGWNIQSMVFMNDASTLNDVLGPLM